MDVKKNLSIRRWVLPVLLVSGLLGHNVASAQESQQCSDTTIYQVAHWAGISQQKNPVVDTICKLMPNSPETLISVVIFDANNIPAEDGGVKIKITALIENGNVVAADKSKIEEDRFTVVNNGSLSIDTAPYNLAPGIRAFGTIFKSGGSWPSCPSFYAERELTLWVREGTTLRPVFGTNLYGWMSLDQNWCNKQSESAHMTLSVEKHKTQGFADITVAAHIKKMDDTEEGYTESEIKVVRKTFHYDGRSYGIDMSRDFWHPKSIDAHGR